MICECSDDKRAIQFQSEWATNGTLFDSVNKAKFAFFVPVIHCVHVCEHEWTHCVGVDSVLFCFFVFFCDIHELYMYLPAHHYAGLVIKAIIQSHWLTHVCQSAAFSNCFPAPGKKEHGVLLDGKL